jgi:hypothetical protein
MDMPGGLRATGHVATLEPPRTRRRVWSHRARDDTRALPGRWSWCLSHVAMLEPSCVGAGLEARGTRRLWSPFLPSDGLGALGHVATPEPFLNG